MAMGGRNAEHFKSFTLPCFSMIATGDCSYENYCKFIHDRRLKCTCRIMHPTLFDRKEMNRRQKNQNATEKGFVVFYWPPMNVEGPHSHHVDRRYHLPPHSMHGGHKDYSYSCMVSMWEHFIGHLTCQDEVNADLMAFNHVNPYTNRPRLPLFRELSLSEVKRNMHRATPVDMYASPVRPGNSPVPFMPPMTPTQLVSSAQMTTQSPHVYMTKMSHPMSPIGPADLARANSDKLHADALLKGSDGLVSPGDDGTTSSERSTESPVPEAVLSAGSAFTLKTTPSASEKRAPPSTRSPQADPKSIHVPRT